MSSSKPTKGQLRLSLMRRALQAVMGITPRADPVSSPDRRTSRAQMDAALKAVVVPHLRRLGFKGTIPHFRRPRGEAIDLLAFQFARSGGKFVVEIGRIGPGGFDLAGRHVAPADAKVFYLKERHRLGSPLRANWGDHWFDFGGCDPFAVAQDVCALLDQPQLWTFVDTLAMRGEFD